MKEAVKRRNFKTHRMKVVNGTFKVTHEAVHVSDCSIGGGMLGDEHQSLTVVLQSLVVLSADKKRNLQCRYVWIKPYSAAECGKILPIKSA